MNVITNIEWLPSYVNFWDEACLALLLITFCLKNIKNGKLYTSCENVSFISPWMWLIVVGLLGNYIFKFALSNDAIFRDIVGMLKFPLGFFLIREIGIDKEICLVIHKKFFIVKFITIIIFLLGIISIHVDFGMSFYDIRYGFKPYIFVFSHPTILVTFATFILLIITASEKRNEYLIYEIMLLIVIMLTFRTKGFGFIVIYIFLKYSNGWNNKIKLLYWLIPLILSCMVGYDKLVLLSNWTGSGRTVLTLGSFELLKDCFPIGSGFATYASHISGAYRSLVYDFIYSSEFFNQTTGEPTPIIGDTGFPYYIGQFGFIGIILITLSVIRIFLIWNNKKFCGNGIAENMLMLYFAITLTTEALLINNGIECALVLAIIIQTDLIQSRFRYS